MTLAFVPASEAADDAAELLAELEPEPLKMAMRFDNHEYALFELAPADCETDGAPLAFDPVTLDPPAFEPFAVALSDS
jgi:hypothetical protein